MSVHTNRKLLKCPLYCKQFAYKQSFKVHMKQKHKLTDELHLAHNFIVRVISSFMKD